MWQPKLTNYTEYDIKWPSLGPDEIVYENGGLLYTYDLKANQARKIPPDSSKIAYSDRKLRLWYVDIEKKEPVLVGTSEFVARPRGSWSPDSRWLAYSKPTNGAGKQAIPVVSAKGKAAVPANK